MVCLLLDQIPKCAVFSSGILMKLELEEKNAFFRVLEPSCDSDWLNLTNKMPSPLHIPNKKRFLVVDDDVQVHHLFKFCFSEDYQIQFAGSIAETFSQVERDEFPVVTLDLILNGESGLEILPRLRQINKFQKIIILTGNSSKQSAITAVNQGAFKYVEKPFAINVIKDAIEEAFSLYSEEQAAAGGKVCSKAELVSLGLNRKEAEIVQWVVQGERNQEIASRLSLSRRTIEKYLEAIFSKLRVNSRMKLGKRIKELRGIIE